MVSANMKTRKCKKQKHNLIKPAPRTVDEWWWMLPHHEKLQALLIAQLVEELTEQKHLEIRGAGGRIKVAWSGLTNVGTMAAEVISFQKPMRSAAPQSADCDGLPLDGRNRPGFRGTPVPTGALAGFLFPEFLAHLSTF
jgi:hypothetical protein